MPVATPKPSTKEGASAIANAVDGAEQTSAIANVVDVADTCFKANTTADTLSFTPVDAHKAKSHLKRRRLEIIDDQKTNNA